MYTEEYEQKGFPFRDFLLKLILIIVIILMVIWILPNITSPKVKTNKDTSTVVTKQVSKNIDKIKSAAVKYYTKKKLPTKTGKSKSITLDNLIQKKYISNIKDKDIDKKKSYAKITKLDNEYLLKVYVKTKKASDYKLYHLGHYDYCKSYLCEKRKTNTQEVKTNQVEETIDINDGFEEIQNIVTDTVEHVEVDNNTDTNTESDDSKNSNDQNSNENNNNSNGNNNNNDTKEDTSKYTYEYQKITPAVMSDWSEWSEWSKTSCQTAEINCDDSSELCLTKLQRTDKREKIGTYKKTYMRQKKTINYTNSYTQTGCSGSYYVIIDGTLYNTNGKYTIINNINSNTKSSTGNWVYTGRFEHSTPPEDTAKVRYIFAGVNYNECTETCTKNPTYYYDKYIYNAKLDKVSSTTQSSLGCPAYKQKEVSIYNTITTYDKVQRDEPVYATTCYKRTTTRKVKKPSKVSTKWSKYNNKTLLNKGWTYTGNKKIK